MSARNKLADRTTRPYERSRRDGDELQPRTRTSRKVEISSRDGQKKTRTPDAKNGDKYQNLFGRTSTLTGAFASTGPALEGNHNNNVGDVRTGRTPRKQNSYREGNFLAVSPRSNASSPRHGDLLEAYRRFSDGDDMDFDGDPYTMAPDPLSPSPSSRQRYNFTSRYVPDPTLDFYDIAMEPPRRRRGSQHASDEERLRRATERGPVLSKAMVGNKRRTSVERVPAQKEEKEVEEMQPKPRFEPSFNVPSSWGQKSKLSKGIIDRMNREDVEDMFEEQPVQASGEWENDLDFTSRSFQVSNSPPLRPRRPSNSPPAFRTKISPRDLERRRDVPGERALASHPPEGNPIPDTLGVTHNESGSDRPRFTKRDGSEELLRKLRRSESPSVTNTPEPKPVDDTISNMKTPVVVGAWIDTPAPERTSTAPEPVNAKYIPSPIAESVEELDKAGPQNFEESKSVSARPPSEWMKPKIRTIRRPRPVLKKPDLPKSGLEAIIEEAKSGSDKSLLVGENTIDSLQGLLLDENPDFSEFEGFDPKDLKPSESDKTSSDEDNPVLPPDAPNEAVIDRMNAKLQSLVRNIKEVRDGLSGLETQATKDVAALSPLSKKRGKKSHSCHSNGEPCEACGLSGDGRLYLALPLPRIWHRRPDTNRIRPTFLGWFLISAIIWWFVECFMCELYCEPLYLDTSRPFSLPDPDAPETPFVIPTMLWRWSGLGPILAPVWTLLVAFYRIWAQLFGFWDGYAPEPPEIPIHLRGGPLMDDVTASQMLARNGYTGRPDPPLDFGRPPPERQRPPVHGYWGQGDADEGLSMDEDEIL